MQVKAVLFDLDGTLLDTLEDLGRAANRILKSRGCWFLLKQHQGALKNYPGPSHHKKWRLTIRLDFDI